MHAPWQARRSDPRASLACTVALLLFTLFQAPSFAEEATAGLSSAEVEQAGGSTDAEELRQQLEAAEAQTAELKDHNRKLKERLAGAEQTRDAAEAARLQAEAAQAQAEKERAEALAQQAQAEKARNKAEEQRTNAEQARGTAEKRLAQEETAKNHAEQQLAKRAQEVLTLQADLDRARKENTALEHRLAQVQDLKQANREREAAIARLENECKALETRNAELKAAKEAETLHAVEQEARLTDTIAEMEREIAALQARLPISEGGTITAEQARAAAAAAGKTLIAALRAGGAGAGGRGNIREAQNQLYEAQMLLSRALGARGVYRVRPQDTLAEVSQQFYGNGGRWKSLYEANEHVLQDPNHLIPGVSLVIP